MTYAVRIYFVEQGREVFDVLGPFTRYFAELVCVDMAAGIMRGGHLVHVTRARIEPWFNA